MDCSACREALSARLDGEDRPGEATATDTHLAGCPTCRTFHDRAARVTRLTRTRLVTSGASTVDPGTLPDVVPDRPRGDVLHALLAAAGVAQLALGVTGLLDAAGAGHHGGVLGGAALAHLGHESAAWNAAVGVGFLAVALRRTRPAGSLVVTLGAFVAVLLATSGVDAVAGRVEAGRLAGHGVLVVGLVLMLVLYRTGPGGRGRSRVGATVTVEADDAPAPAGALPTERRVDLRPSARRAA
ncbi:membrane protein [Pseudonocardia sulfidoxydans NBRC 16205]|uniref:Membrane protein n=1 Tax=Pseudonocardia sulfidoxydans NBRC 16205 TaxID=1223511 RepID=A0A511DCU5_9PSEU|nr:zf-HC2 domain-containing protein [Pseudonocardia sulfidoxydans]GEL22619.1 membrane protein [Pseudonocardia sulfidoxydans NBRC 16205]